MLTLTWSISAAKVRVTNGATLLSSTTPILPALSSWARYTEVAKLYLTPTVVVPSRFAGPNMPAPGPGAKLKLAIHTSLNLVCQSVPVRSSQRSCSKILSTCDPVSSFVACTVGHGCLGLRVESCSLPDAFKAHGQLRSDGL